MYIYVTGTKISAYWRPLSNERKNLWCYPARPWLRRPAPCRARPWRWCRRVPAGGPGTPCRYTAQPGADITDGIISLHNSDKHLVAEDASVVKLVLLLIVRGVEVLHRSRCWNPCHLRGSVNIDSNLLSPQRLVENRNNECFNTS